MAVAIVLAFAGGIAFLFFFLGIAFGLQATKYDSSQWPMTALVSFLAIAIAIVVPGLLTAFLRPVPVWLFPLAFAASTLFLALLRLFEEPLAGLGTVALGAVEFGLGFVGSKLVLRH